VWCGGGCCPRKQGRGSKGGGFIRGGAALWCMKQPGPEAGCFHLSRGGSTSARPARRNQQGAVSFWGPALVAAGSPAATMEGPGAHAACTCGASLTRANLPAPLSPLPCRPSCMMAGSVSGCRGSSGRIRGCIAM
jgi:hypothetical protein